MISNFSFESPVEFKNTITTTPSVGANSAAGLQLPLAVPGNILDLEGVDSSLSALLEHFAPLGLQWYPELDDVRGGMRITGILDENNATGGVWALVILECASIAKHCHNAGGAYGECSITLAGELDDFLDDGTPVKLCSGAVMFHAVNTIHEPSTERFWVGLCHQPTGSMAVE